MNRLLMLAISLLCTYVVSAQEPDSVAVHKDPRIDLLVSKQIEINDITTRASRRKAIGYRILVISSNERKKVDEAKARMYREFPRLEAYKWYQAPFYRLKIGNFREREEASDYLLQIQQIYPQGVYIVRDSIDLKL